MGLAIKMTRERLRRSPEKKRERERWNELLWGILNAHHKYIAVLTHIIVTLTTLQLLSAHQIIGL